MTRKAAPRNWCVRARTTRSSSLTAIAHGAPWRRDPQTPRLDDSEGQPRRHAQRIEPRCGPTADLVQRGRPHRVNRQPFFTTARFDLEQPVHLSPNLHHLRFSAFETAAGAAAVISVDTGSNRPWWQSAQNAQSLPFERLAARPAPAKAGLKKLPCGCL